MQSEGCSICQKPKAGLTCGLCSCQLCKQCAQTASEDGFSFLKEVPAELTHDFYCAPCFDEKVAPAVAEYEETMERARGIHVFTKDQSKETRLIKRKENALKVTDCDDYDEAIMRLAFQAAKISHNAIVDVDLVSKKVRMEAYQTTVWSATAIPVTIDPKRYDRPDAGNPN